MACALGASCGDAIGYRARLELADGLGSRVERIELTLVSRACDAQSADRVSGVVRVVEGGRRFGVPPLGEVPDDAESIVARGFDADCSVVGYGCTDLVLENGGGGDVLVRIEEADGGACDGTCVDARCSPMDEPGRFDAGDD